MEADAMTGESARDAASAAGHTLVDQGPAHGDDFAVRDETRDTLVWTGKIDERGTWEASLYPALAREHARLR